MTLPRLTAFTFHRAVHISVLGVLPFCWLSIAHAQGARKATETSIADTDSHHEEQRSQWFLRGRVIQGKSSAELRRRAYQAKMRARAALAARALSEPPGTPPSTSPSVPANSVRNSQPKPQTPPSSLGWTSLGPLPLASDASGDGFQNYNQVSGRATAVAIDPADPTGNTVYIGGAQGGVWKSTNATASIATNVTWSPVTDDQATLSIGAIAIQPGNSDPAQSV